MQSGLSIPPAVLIFADETAEWKVAGLRQVDRVKLAVAEFFQRAGVTAPVVIVHERSQPANFDSLGRAQVLLLSTRVVPGRRSLEREGFPSLLLEAEELCADPAAILRRLRDTEHTAKSQADDWGYLAEPTDIGSAASKLFQSTGKSQDGIISRYVNRPLSRNLSRLLVRTSLLPNQLTILLMALPVAGAISLLRGDYFGFALGAVLFQLHSTLDGCDGEIARVKYLESESGSKLDALCDRYTTLLFAISLGFGLSRQLGIIDALRWTYTAEGVGAALFIGIAETLLTRTRIEDRVAGRHDRYGNYLTSHRERFNQGDQLKLWMIKRTGMLSLGEGATSFFGELTKRDVFNFVFMLLAVCGLASWVLHILAFSACVILVLALKEMLAPTLDANSAA